MKFFSSSVCRQAQTGRHRPGQSHRGLSAHMHVQKSFGGHLKPATGGEETAASTGLRVISMQTTRREQKF